MSPLAALAAAAQPPTGIEIAGMRVTMRSSPEETG
jgi:hypothetical protein